MFIRNNLVDRRLTDVTVVRVPGKAGESHIHTHARTYTHVLEHIASGWQGRVSSYR